MVRRRDGAVHKPRQLVETGIGVRGTGREAAIFGRPGATSNAHLHLPDDRLFRFTDPRTVPHSNAGTFRRVPLHGRRVPQGTSIFRQDVDHVYAPEVPTGSYVPSTSKHCL